MTDPASGTLFSSGIDPNPGSRHGSPIDPNPGSHNGAAGDGGANALLMQALTSSRSALHRGSDDWFDLRRPARPNLWQLDPELLVTVVQKQLGQRLMVRDRTLWLTGVPDANGQMAPPAVKLLTIAATPDVTTLKRQTRVVVKRAEERPDRAAEIQVQADDLWPFFTAVTYVVPSRAPKTAATLAVVSALASAVVQQLKHQVACARPTDCSADVQPMLTNPSHASLPSGHATAAFAMQIVLQALLGLPDDAGVSKVMRRLARRIADNRVVAGLHFPMDGCAGWLLADTLARALLGLADKKRRFDIGRSFDANDPRFRSEDPTRGDLPPGDAPFEVDDVPGCSSTAEDTRQDLVDDWALLWEAARTELKTLGLRPAA